MIATAKGLKIGLVYNAFRGSFMKHFPDMELLKPGQDVSKFDLLIFPGGDDVDPKRYGQENQFSYVNPDRDSIEFGFFEAADKLKIKMYGSCRGLQVFNVGRGGTLYQDLSMVNKAHTGNHTLNWERNSKKLGPILSTVNSLHHQGIQRLGRELYTYATFNGIPEIIYDENILATQFHPEMMSNMDPFFTTLIEWVTAGKTPAAPAPAAGAAQA